MELQFFFWTPPSIPLDCLHIVSIFTCCFTSSDRLTLSANFVHWKATQVDKQVEFEL